MIHLVFCLRRLPNLSRAEFQRYWRDRHAPLVKAYAAALHIKRYVQAHTIEHPVAQAAAQARGASAPFDGVAELWFDSEELTAAVQTPAAQEAMVRLLEDEARFIDLKNSPVFFTEDTMVIGH
ncbi:MAG: EthD domain-containing protein [Candidatus Binatia bacterium]